MFVYIEYVHHFYELLLSYQLVSLYLHSTVDNSYCGPRGGPDLSHDNYLV